VLVTHGGALGFALSWMVHNLLTDFHLARFATPEQAARHLPGILAGDTILALAVSEPETGAHPKHLKTRAERDGDGYVINGTEAFTSNGPIADLLEVFAVTGVDAEGLNEVTAFLVPAGAPGVDRSTVMELPMVRSSPHGIVHLRDVHVPTDAVLGTEGRAYPTMVRPFRAIEDSFALSLLTGHVAHTAWLLGDAVGPDGGPEAHTAFGVLGAALTGMRSAARAAARLRDAAPEDLAAIDEQVFASGLALERAEGAIRELAAVVEGEHGEALERALADLGLYQVGRRAEGARVRKHGAALAKEPAQFKQFR